MSVDSPISNGGSGLPSRLILHGVAGIGKTSFGAMAPNPVFLMTRSEDGLMTLIDNGLVPETDHFPTCETWADVIKHLKYLHDNDTGHKSLVIDTINGCERLCFEQVARQQFNNDWNYFLKYGAGPDKSQQEWLEFLGVLNRLREKKKMLLIGLCHTRVKNFKNPEGDDYERFAPDMHDKTWALSDRWADIVLFANHETFAKKDKGQLRAKGGSTGRRLFYTTRTAAWDAKNRYQLPEEIDMGDNPLVAWKKFTETVRLCRQARLEKPSTGE